MSELINNNDKRVETLAEIIKGLKEGKDQGAVKKKLSELVRTTTSEEIIAMEQKLISDGMSVGEVKGMCDLHSQVLGDMLTEKIEAQTTPGHPANTFHAENMAIRGVVGEMRDLVGSINESNLAEKLPEVRGFHEKLLEVEKHYARKENVLFPYLERHGVTGPSQVMWAKDDDIRVLLKSFRTAVADTAMTFDTWSAGAKNIVGEMLDQIEEMTNKEENILLPISLKKLSPEEWGHVHRDSPRFGFCLIEPGNEYAPATVEQEDSAESSAMGLGAAAATIGIGAGNVTPDQLNAFVKVLPFDLTFVDADDRVAFFSEGADRVFARTPSIIGRMVQNCHPPQSVDVVDRILSDFRSGKQDVAEFWINLQGRFVHIRYFAVRDDAGEYMGTLEVTQDLTHPRALDGERRLLQYDGQPT